MTASHDRQLQRDLITLTALVEHLTHAHDDALDYRSAEDLADHRIAFNSVAMEIIQSQECANRLSETTISAAPNLPWNVLRAIRNIIVHEYGAIDSQALYDTAIYDLPGLIAQLQELAEQLEGRGEIES